MLLLCREMSDGGSCMFRVSSRTINSLLFPSSFFHLIAIQRRWTQLFSARRTKAVLGGKGAVNLPSPSLPRSQYRKCSRSELICISPLSNQRGRENERRLFNPPSSSSLLSLSLSESLFLRPSLSSFRWEIEIIKKVEAEREGKKKNFPPSSFFSSLRSPPSPNRPC